MAILTPVQLDELRQNYSIDFSWKLVREDANDIFQAIEDVFTSPAVQNALSNAIDNATIPIVLTANEKRSLVKFWLRQRAERGN